MKVYDYGFGGGGGGAILRATLGRMAREGRLTRGGLAGRIGRGIAGLAGRARAFAGRVFRGR